VELVAADCSNGVASFLLKAAKVSILALSGEMREKKQGRNGA
jgi:hypothetical protein